MGRSNIVQVQLQVGTALTLALTSVTEDPLGSGMYKIVCDGRLTRTDTGTSVSGKPIYAWTKNVQWDWNRSAIPVDTTDANGLFTITIINVDIYGLWEIQAEFQGDAEYAGC